MEICQVSMAAKIALMKFDQDSVKNQKNGLLFIEHRGMNRHERAPDWSNTLVVYLVDTTRDN